MKCESSVTGGTNGVAINQHESFSFAYPVHVATRQKNQSSNRDIVSINIEPVTGR